MQTTILSIENARNWSWGIISDRLAEALMFRYRFLHIIRKPRIPIDQDLINYFPATLMQNADNMALIGRNKGKVVCRMGGMIIDHNAKPTRYDHWLAQCGAIISTNRQLYNIASNVNPNSFLVPNPIDLLKFRPKPVLWPNHGGKFTVGFAGNIWGMGAEYKGWKVYAEAVINLMTEVTKRECLHNGPASQSQLPHDRMCEGFYWKIDCLILPSINEGCSNVIGEALACGIPVLCTPVGYHGEALTDGENVLFIERDRDDIVEKVRLLKNDPALYARLSANGRQFVEQNQGIDKIAHEYDLILKTVLRNQQQ